MGRLVPLHDNTRVMSGVGSESEEAQIVAEIAARLQELAQRKTWQAVGSLLRDLAAYSQMSRNVGPLACMELRLIVACLAGDVGELRAAHSEATANGCSKQAHHQIMHTAFDRIAKRNPRVADELRKLRAINLETTENATGQKLEAEKEKARVKK